MWLMTPRGFYSAVEKTGDQVDDMVTVRTRSKRDLDNLRDLLPNAEYPPRPYWSDYPFRLRCTRQEWSDAVATMALEIDYSNFKDRVAAKQGKKRAGIYNSVWSALLGIEGWKNWSTRWQDDEVRAVSGTVSLDDLPGERVEDALREKQDKGQPKRQDSVKETLVKQQKRGGGRKRGGRR